MVPSTSPRTVRVGALQMQSGENVAQNLVQVGRLLDEASAAGVEVAVLPENFAYFGPDTGKAAVAEALDHPGPILRFLAEEAHARGLGIIAGGMPEASSDSGRPYNTSFAIDRTGAVLAAYRKLHLFDVDLGAVRYAESSGTAPGREVRYCELSGLGVGLTICYDLRFPLLFRRLVELGSNVLVVTAAFTQETGEAHWEVLLRARAIESQAWVVAAAQWGEHGRGRRTFGHSSIVDPWGRIVASKDSGVGLVVADVDLAEVDRVRERLPSLRHFREL